MFYKSKFALLASSSLALSTLAIATSASALETKLPFPGTISGNISVISNYNVRGITNAPETTGAAVQGGLDYNHPSGFYLGYWASNVDYSYASLNPECPAKCSATDARNSLESDFAVGYKGKLNADTSYQIGVTSYYYYPGWESTAYETILGVTFQNLTLSAQTLLNDVSYGNSGDTYFQASYSHPLPSDFTGRVVLGANSYAKKGDFLAEEATKTSFSFRHVTLGLSHPLGTTGATMNVDYIIGGYDRLEIKQKNKLVLGIGYAF